jgi:hypothetical protein
VRPKQTERQMQRQKETETMTERERGKRNKERARTILAALVTCVSRWKQAHYHSLGDKDCSSAQRPGDHGGGVLSKLIFTGRGTLSFGVIARQL